ncbi:MAG TPA: histidine phosphatase family protein [Thermoanaerobaculia bacterium]|nr:histidine phosphatase family protein [Thermoanaerobaculia bacterium]
MKFLVLLRHGIAEDPSPEKNDIDRELTAKGRRRMEAIAAGLARVFPEAEAIYSSPAVRAMQTAAPVAKRYGLKIQKSDDLAPGRPPRKVVGEAGVDFAIFVGHEPTLSELMLELTRTEGEIELKKGGCYGIAFVGETPRLEWILTPRVLRRLR